jgi:hypothetical protein
MISTCRGAGVLVDTRFELIPGDSIARQQRREKLLWCVSDASAISMSWHLIVRPAVVIGARERG